ncbi:efflux RND transporter permease subunit [Ammoniphilus sp. CFH 90114]|nr:efflux RND transporter permease subunit [Ammoniphilus sp. CFH 90114]
MMWMFKRSKVVIITIILLTLIGVLTFIQLPKRDVPEVMPNVATIKTVFPGASPEEVERNITNPLEEKLLELDGLKKASSVSADGFSNIVLEFENDFKKDTVFSDIRQKVSNVALQFPDQVRSPEINTDIRPSAVASYHIVGLDRTMLTSLREDLKVWEEELVKLPKVAKIQWKGLPEEEITIRLDPLELKEHGLFPFQVIQAIQAEFSPQSIGRQDREGTSYLVKMRNYTQLAEFSSVMIGKGRYGESIYLRDVGTVALSPKETTDLITHKGKPTLSFTIFAEKGADIPSLQRSIEAKMTRLTEGLPEGIEVVPFYLQSVYVEQTFKNLAISFIMAIIAVASIMLLGLSISASLLVTLAIPMSILVGLVPLPYTGVDLNQISIIGMIIAIGILVDDAIVVNENIHRRYALGDSALEGAVNGINEVKISIFTSSIMIIFSFFPLTFLSGTGGSFIRALPTVLIFTIIGSTFVALTFVPIMTYWRRSRKEGKGVTSKRLGLLYKMFTKLETYYADKVLAQIIKRPFTISFLGLFLCIMLTGLAAKIPFEFFPPADREEVTIQVTLPNGTKLVDTYSQLESIERQLLQDPAIKETAVFAGTGLPGLFNSTLANPGLNTGQILVRVDLEQTSTTAMMARWEMVLRENYPSADIMLETIESGPPVGAPVAIQIVGPGLEELIDLAEILKLKLAAIEETKLVTVDIGTPQPVIEYIPDRAKLDYFGFTTQEISEQVRLASTGIQLGIFDDGVERRDLKVFLDTQGGEGEVDLSKIELRPKDYQQVYPTVSVHSLVTENITEQIQRIPHQDGKRTITVRAYPVEGKKKEFEQSALVITNQMKESLRGDYTLNVGGETSERTDFFIEVTKLFVIVLFLIYLVIVIQFNSLSMPVLILSSVYLAVTGAIIGLFITQTPLSFLAVLGIVSLSGIAVRNSIILIEFIEQRREVGEDIEEAIKDSGRARIRPIILTSLTSIAALLPIVFSGDVLFKPLAISIVSGLLFSTVLTLILTPTFYLSLSRIRNKG